MQRRWHPLSLSLPCLPASPQVNCDLCADAKPARGGLLPVRATWWEVSCLPPKLLATAALESLRKVSMLVSWCLPTFERCVHDFALAHFRVHLSVVERLDSQSPSSNPDTAAGTYSSVCWLGLAYPLPSTASSWASGEDSVIQRETPISPCAWAQAQQKTSYCVCSSKSAVDVSRAPTPGCGLRTSN